MGTSSDPRLSKKVGKFYCGRFVVRALRDQDTDRMTAWLSDPEALEVLNLPARRLTKTDIANFIRSFDQRTNLLGGIFDRSNNMLVGILQWHGAWSPRLRVGGWERDVLRHRGAGLRRDTRNEHTQHVHRRRSEFVY